MVTLPRNAQLWLPGYVRQQVERAALRRPAGPIDVLFCVADHFEPDHGRVDAATERARVVRWLDEFPTLASPFRDADGFPPQHTFFFPLEVYRAAHIDRLAELCEAGFGEVEVHLHHQHDSSANLRQRLEWFRDTLAVRHGLLGRDAAGRPVYGFIHGNWALDNGRPDGQWCGVNDEITVLRQTGCYADFTMPAAPDPAQSRTVNSIYYAVDDPRRPRSYDSGSRARTGVMPPRDGLLMVQGPLTLRWDVRVARVLPRLDNAAIDSTPLHHPTIDRFRRWVAAGISVSGRPEWVFVKVHTHGAKERNADVLLGHPMRALHIALASEFNDGRQYRLHYVTAREMHNIVKAAEDGKTGNAGDYRDYTIARPARALPATGTAPL
jgi:hypothetical protein